MGKKSKKLSKKSYFNIAARTFNRPLLLEPNYAVTAFKVLAKRLDFDGGVVHGDLPALRRKAGESPEERYSFAETEYPEWYKRPDGTAVVPVQGTMMHSGNPMASMGRSYGALANDLTAAHSDESVKRIALLVDTNGGEVSGCSTCADLMTRVIESSDKPTWAYVDESMFSAGMWTGSTAQRLIGANTSEVGSIGVVQAHASYEQAMREEGVKVTFIHSGDKKVQGNPYFDLTAEDLRDMQAGIEEYGDIFYEAMDSLLPNMSEEAIRDTQAGTFVGKSAQEVGMLDAVMNKADFFNEFAEFEASATTISMGENTVTEAEKQALKDKNKSLEAENDRLKKQAEKDKQESDDRIAAAEEKAEKIEAEAKRRDEVMGHEDVVGREAHAKEMLEDELFANFSAEQIVAQVSKMAKVEAEGDPKGDGDQKLEEELNDDTKALLNNARRGAAGGSGGVTNKGEGAGADSGTPSKTKKAEYDESFPEDRSEMMAGFLRSASIVKANKQRDSI